MLTQTCIDGADYSRDLYTSYGRTTIFNMKIFLMNFDKIGSIGFAATSLSSKQDFVLSYHSLC